MSRLLLSLSILSCTANPVKRQENAFTFYDLKTPLSGPCDLVEGPDGALWGESILVNHIFRVDIISGDVEEYPIPFTNRTDIRR